MRLYEKIDFLMKVTDTANSTLGKYVSFDASYISRTRSGKRNIPKHGSFLEKTSAFFAERIESPYQKKIVSQFLGLKKEWPGDKAAKERL